MATTMKQAVASLDRALMELLQLRDSKKSIEENISEVQVAAIQMMDHLGEIKHTSADGRLQATKVSPEHHEIVAEKLRQEIGNEAYNRLTKRVLDDEKVKAAIVTGDLTPAVVEKCSIERSPRPYVKVKLQREVAS